jgi:hypothetical protein
MTCEDLLQQSCTQYGQLLTELDEIGRRLKNGQAVDLPLERWMKLQQEARRTDEEIEAFREREPESLLCAPTLETRRDLMGKLAGRCREVFSQAAAHKALIRDELSRLRSGRKAISGYKTAPTETGNRIGSRH